MKYNCKPILKKVYDIKCERYVFKQAYLFLIKLYIFDI